MKTQRPSLAKQNLINNKRVKVNMKAKFFLAAFIFIIILGGLVISPTMSPITVPDKPAESSASAVTITVNGKQPTGGAIIVDTKGTLSIEIKGLKKGKDLFLGLGKDIDKDRKLEDLSKQKGEIADPNNIKYTTIKNKIFVKILAVSTESKKFRITGWAGEGIVIAACQDKGGNGYCKEEGEYAKAAIAFEEVTIDTILQGLARIDKKLADDLSK